MTTLVLAVVFFNPYTQSLTRILICSSLWMLWLSVGSEFTPTEAV